MTLFRTDDPAPLPEATDDGHIASPPRTVVRIAAAAIVLMAGFGLARGVMIDRSPNSEASPLAVLAGVSSASVAGAKPAVVLAKDESWSTLSGPRMLDPADKPKTEAKVAASDDDAADSDSPAAQTAAADAIAPDAPDAAPAAPAASSSAAPTPAPQ